MTNPTLHELFLDLVATDTDASELEMLQNGTLRSLAELWFLRGRQSGIEDAREVQAKVFQEAVQHSDEIVQQH